jgi:biopolymer transport protein ExbD
MCDINTTPLIDVMLVLLIMFIITIPVMTHAVKLDMPRPTDAPPPPVQARESSISRSTSTAPLSGTARPVTIDQLEGYFRTGVAEGSAARAAPAPRQALALRTVARYLLRRSAIA